MRFDVVTLFPAMFAAITGQGITRRAYELGLWSLTAWNPRDFTSDAHRTVDDRPYGGGPGMVMMAEPLAEQVVGDVRPALLGGDVALAAHAGGHGRGTRHLGCVGMAAVQR